MGGAGDSDSDSGGGERGVAIGAGMGIDMGASRRATAWRIGIFSSSDGSEDDTAKAVVSAAANPMPALIESEGDDDDGSENEHEKDGCDTSGGGSGGRGSDLEGENNNDRGGSGGPREENGAISEDTKEHEEGHDSGSVSSDAKEGETQETQETQETLCGDLIVAALGEDVCRRLDNIGVSSATFFAQNWFLSLFTWAQAAPAHVSLVWAGFMLHGLEFIFRVGLARLRMVAECVLETPCDEDVLPLLVSWDKMKEAVTRRRENARGRDKAIATVARCSPKRPGRVAGGGAVPGSGVSPAKVDASAGRRGVAREAAGATAGAKGARGAREGGGSGGGGGGGDGRGGGVGGIAVYGDEDGGAPLPLEWEVVRNALRMELDEQVREEIWQLAGNPTPEVKTSRE